MGKKSSPKPPDYQALAEQTADNSAQSIRDQTYANRINQSNPWGSTEFTNWQEVDPASGEMVTRWGENTTLTPELQAALDSQIKLQQGRSDLAGGMMGDITEDFSQRQDYSQYGDPIGMDPMDRIGGAGEGMNRNFDAGRLGNVNTNIRDSFNFDDPGLQRQDLQDNLDYSGAPDVNAPEWTREAAEQSVYDRGASRLDPQIAQEQQALDVRLRSQGLNPGDEAYKAQMTNFEQRKTDAYDALNAQAMQEGSRQAESMFGMESQFRDQSTGEEDRMKDFANQSMLSQFGMDKDMQAQLFDIAHQTGLFGQGADIARMQGMLTGRGQDAQQNALNLQAQGMGNQAQQQAWSQMMQGANYNQNLGFRENALQNQLRTQGMDEDAQQRSARLNEMNALLSGQQVSSPQFRNYSQQGLAQHADALGAGDMGFQAQMAGFGADQAMLNSLMGGLGQGAGMMGMFSDRRLKSNIAKIGEKNGSNWYIYDIFGRTQIGVMADENPQASFEHPSGYLMVDYRRI